GKARDADRRVARERVLHLDPGLHLRLEVALLELDPGRRVDLLDEVARLAEELLPVELDPAVRVLRDLKALLVLPARLRRRLDRVADRALGLVAELQVVELVEVLDEVVPLAADAVLVGRFLDLVHLVRGERRRGAHARPDVDRARAPGRRGGRAGPGPARGGR